MRKLINGNTIKRKKLNENNEYETLYHKNYSQQLLTNNSLSNREQDVIRLLTLNKTSKEIGEKLFISSHKNHISVSKKSNVVIDLVCSSI